MIYTIEQFKERCEYMMSGAIGIANWYEECLQLSGVVYEQIDNTYTTGNIVERAILQDLADAIDVELYRWS